MATIFWDCEGMLLIDLKETNATVNDKYYAALLRKLRDNIPEKRRGKLNRGIRFHLGAVASQFCLDTLLSHWSANERALFAPLCNFVIIIICLLYWSIRYLAVGFFFLFFLLCAAGLRGTFPGHPRLPSLLLFPFWTTQHEIQHKHPWEAHPAWDLNPADLAVVSEECRSSFHHPTVSP
jgi:hypothetical protein